MKTIDRAGQTKAAPKKGLGDYGEIIAHPIAVAMKLPCLDKHEELRPESPCARRRAWLNEQGKKIGIGV